MTSEFTVTMESDANAPRIEFHFRGDTCRASLVGAALYVEAERDGAARMRLTDAAGEVLADITAHPRSHRSLTENVTDLGCALLWSHWRWCEAKARVDVHE